MVWLWPSQSKSITNPVCRKSKGIKGRHLNFIWTLCPQEEELDFFPNHFSVCGSNIKFYNIILYSVEIHWTLVKCNGIVEGERIRVRKGGTGGKDKEGVDKENIKWSDGGVGGGEWKMEQELRQLFLVPPPPTKDFFGPLYNLSWAIIFNIMVSIS